MDFKQVYVKGLAHCSYVIAGKNECIVVDPARDVDQYLQIAESFNKPIVAILETHLHADFISGHMDLMEKTGATIYITANARAQYPHHAMHDGEEIFIDTLKIKMIDTPGHTPDCSVYIVSDLERGEEPALAFTGDTLMVGDAGRPDLFPDIKEDLATKLYHSLRKVETIGDHVEVYPAHGAGSLCGKLLSSKLSSTVGTERMFNGALNIHPLETFVHSFLVDMPEAPDHFARCSDINRKGPATIASLQNPVALSPTEFLNLVPDCVVVDTRDQLPFGAAHVPGAYGLSLRGNFPTFSGWVLPPDKPLLLIVENEQDLAAALKGLYAVGLDRVIGYLNGGMSAWAAAGYETQRLESISVQELHKRFTAGDLLLVDTRLKSEYDAGHIKGSVHAPAPDVRSRYNEFVTDRPVAFICNTGNRSLLAASLMQNFSNQRDIVNVIGGTSAWINMGFPIVEGESQ